MISTTSILKSIFHEINKFGMASFFPVDKAMAPLPPRCLSHQRQWLDIPGERGDQDYTGRRVFLHPFWRRVFLHLNLSRISTPLLARGENGVHVFLYPIFGLAYFYTSSICRVFLHPFLRRVFLHPRGVKIRDTLHNLLPFWKWVIFVNGLDGTSSTNHRLANVNWIHFKNE